MGMLLLLRFSVWLTVSLYRGNGGDMVIDCEAALFEVPSNYVMKHWVRPSLWLAILLFCWGALTIGFAGVHNYATVVVLRFLIGVFEAGFFPGTCVKFIDPD
jgi:MFS family permease